MNKNRIDTHVLLAKEIIDAYMNNLKIDTKSAAFVAQFALDLIDFLQVSGKI